jgi:hypothetical protein
LDYGDVLWTCDTATVTGTTSDPASDVLDVDIEFQEPCDVNGLDATFECDDGEFTRLRALDAITNQGEVDELLPGFNCDMDISGICRMNVAPPGSQREQ